jgi:hypothetical protein
LQSCKCTGPTSKNTPTQRTCIQLCDVNLQDALTSSLCIRG